MSILRTHILLLALVLSPRATFAQLPSNATSALAGQWRFEIAPTDGIQMPTTRGIMAIAVRGDTLEARVDWIAAADGRTSPSQLLRGRAVGDTALLVTEADGSASADSRVASIRPVISWRLAPRARGLVGVIVIEIPGMSLPIEPMPVHAERVVAPPATAHQCRVLDVRSSPRLGEITARSPLNMAQPHSGPRATRHDASACTMRHA
jgi:hypothetical protein